MGDLRASVGEKDDAQTWLQVAVFGERANTRGHARSVPAGRAIIVIKPAMADVEPA